MFVRDILWAVTEVVKEADSSLEGLVSRDKLLTCCGQSVLPVLDRAESIVASGKVNELLPRLYVSKVDLAYIRCDRACWSGTNGDDGVCLDGQYGIGVGRGAADLFVDDGGWFSQALSLGGIGASEFVDLVLKRLSHTGVAYISPVRRKSLSPLLGWLNWIKCRVSSFRYEIELIDDSEYRLIVWGNPEIEVGGADVVPVNFSRLDLTGFANKDAMFDKNLKRRFANEDSGESMSMETIRWLEFESLRLGPGEQLGFSDKYLYLSYIDLSKIQRWDDFLGLVDDIRGKIKKDRRTKYVVTLTWMAKWVRALGMKKASVAINKETIAEEVNAINAQIMEVEGASYKNPIVMTYMRDFVEKRRFKLEDVGYWYCRADDFGGRFLRPASLQSK